MCAREHLQYLGISQQFRQPTGETSGFALILIIVEMPLSVEFSSSLWLRKVLYVVTFHCLINTFKLRLWGELGNEVRTWYIKFENHTVYTH